MYVDLSMLFINAFINLICFLAGSPSGSRGTLPCGEPSGERVRTPSVGVRTPSDGVRTPTEAPQLFDSSMESDTGGVSFQVPSSPSTSPRSPTPPPPPPVPVDINVNIVKHGPRTQAASPRRFHRVTEARISPSRRPTVRRGRYN